MKLSPDDEQFLPLSSREYVLLLALSKCPMHGYGLARQVELDSSNMVSLSASTLYTTLARLLKRGLIQSEGEERAERSANPRQMYDLSTVGRTILKAETKRLAAAVDLATERLGHSE